MQEKSCDIPEKYGHWLCWAKIGNLLKVILRTGTETTEREPANPDVVLVFIFV